MKLIRGICFLVIIASIIMTFRANATSGVYLLITSIIPLYIILKILKKSFSVFCKRKDKFWDDLF